MKNRYHTSNEIVVSERHYYMKSLSHLNEIITNKSIKSLLHEYTNHYDIKLEIVTYNHDPIEWVCMHVRVGTYLGPGNQTTFLDVIDHRFV